MGAVEIAFVGGTLALIAIIGGVALVRERARREAFQALAAQLGLRYVGKDPGSFRQSLEGLAMLRSGRRLAITNLIQGTRDGVELAVFDFRYVKGSGNQSKPLQQTVVCLRSPALHVPAFVLQTELKLLGSLINLLGFSDINFPSHPTFSERYLLHGPDEAAVRQAFNAEVLQFFEQQQQELRMHCVEGRGDTLLLYPAARRFSPEETPDRITLALRVLKAFSAAG